MLSSQETPSISNQSQTLDSSSHHIPDHEGGIHFNPPLYRQRYMFTLDTILRDHSLHSLLDIGCGTCQLLTIAKYHNPHIQLIAAMDIIRYQLDEGYFRLKPLPVEYMIFRRETPLHIYVVQGNATEICHCFQHFDVVTLIEVIEHLYLNDLKSLVKHVFGFIRPRLVIVSTPNADFNVLFSTMTYGHFRHADHKFEFTRQQFHDWANAIVQEYGYVVEFHGVGEAPPHEKYQNIGACTQIAVFHRPNKTPRAIQSITSTELYQRMSQCSKHELVGFIDYPCGLNNATEVHEQVRYILDMYRLMAEDQAQLGDDKHDTFPLTVSFQALSNHPRLVEHRITDEDLQQIVQSVGYKLDGNHQIILSQNPLSQSHEDPHEDDHDDNRVLHQSETTQPTHQHHQQDECWD